MTVAEDRGLFLGETWRLCPEISGFVSEMFYENRLVSERGCARQRISGPTSFEGTGLRYVPTEHEGNQTSSSEEVDRIVEIYNDLTQDSVQWTDRKGKTQPLRNEDILIVAPYNAQVGLLGQALPQAKIGTVDKFQGQGEAVVIYSLTTSTPEEAPRGMGFLYSGNRLNVAVSRAKCLSIIVGSPRLFEPDCITPQQMRWANSFCRYLELCSLPRDPSNEVALGKATRADGAVIPRSKSGGGKTEQIDPTTERTVEQVFAKMERLAGLYYRLVLVVGPSGSGKTAVLKEVARQRGAALINVGLELSKRLLNYTDRQRGLRLRNEIDDLLGSNEELVVLDNTEILFDPLLQQDPLQLLQKLSRSRGIVASWNGVIGGKYLTHAVPEHPEYKRYATMDLILVNLELAA